MDRSMTPRTILVHHDGTRHADDLIRLGYALAGPEGQVVALAVVRVAPSLPLDGLPPRLDRKAKDALRRAQDAAHGCGRDVEPHLRRGRDVARVIVLEAEWIGADAIVLNVHRPRAWWAATFSRTIRDVVRHAPCPVFIGSFREPGPLQAKAAIVEAERVLTHAQ